MPRLYSDLLDGTNRRYYFGLNAAPGGITNATPAMLTISGGLIVVQEQATVFRTPAPAALTLNGLSVGAEPRLQPAPAVLSMVGQIPAEERMATITNALPPDYGVLPDNSPQILFINTISPTTAALQLQVRDPNVTQGGNIGFVSPAKATLTLAGYAANIPFFAGSTGQLSIAGLLATLHTTTIVSPEPATLQAEGLAQALGLPFRWVDEAPASEPVWLDETSA